MATDTLWTLPGYGNIMKSLESPSPAVVQGQEAFLRNLSQLLLHYRGQWVAYLGSERVAHGRTHDDVYRRCLECKLDEEEFVVLCVEPIADAPA